MRIKNTNLTGLVKIILPRILEFFGLTIRFNSSRCIWNIKDEQIFTFVFLKNSRIRGKQSNT
ncbi:MAG: hypothetical protein A3G95_06485 [Flavobacteria bacterium RIFCSPLOWO2_12_FULL_31_7]|nr:MAG: hypothetical protein A3G95_06485 [Flavobacteria bacterium RIFCSPLOWO2_12_FULL_31_7]